MFEINDDLSIYATRGDIVVFSVTAKDGENAYKFKAGDVLRIKVFAKKDCTDVCLQKDFYVAAQSEFAEIHLTSKDTKLGDVISKPKDYWYEIELNPDRNPQTIIGYDEDGPKLFKLFPEGKDLPNEEPEITPEDIPIVDSELDLSSQRPVTNQAITRELTKLKDAFNNYKTCHLLKSDDDVNDLFENGWYVYQTSGLPLNAPFKNAAVIEVFGAESKYSPKIQRATRYGQAGQSKFRVLFEGQWSDWGTIVAEYEDDIYSGCYYRLVDGVKEWSSPPLVEGVEYRTTERHNGNAVYVKRIMVESLPDKGQVNTRYCSSGSTDVVRYEAKIFTSEYDAATGKQEDRYYNMPAIIGSDIAARCLLTKWNVVVDTYREGMGVYSCTCTVWYTKT